MNRRLRGFSQMKIQGFKVACDTDPHAFNAAFTPVQDAFPPFTFISIHLPFFEK